MRIVVPGTCRSGVWTRSGFRPFCAFHRVWFFVFRLVGDEPVMRMETAVSSTALTVAFLPLSVYVCRSSSMATRTTDRTTCGFASASSPPTRASRCRHTVAACTVACTYLPTHAYPWVRACAVRVWIKGLPVTHRTSPTERRVPCRLPDQCLTFRVVRRHGLPRGMLHAVLDAVDRPLRLHIAHRAGRVGRRAARVGRDPPGRHR